ncbi:MAG: DUF1573 domain-containing protein [Planctomycetota bacterium]|jgi:hypothetical protein
MSGKKRHALAAGLLLAAMLGIGGAILWWTVRGPLAGETYHDFGRVAVEGRTATVEHVFALTNRTSRTVEIVEIIPACGCTTVDLTDRTLEPGDDVELTVALTVGNGTRKKSITLIVDDGERERTTVLWVKATGRATETLSATRSSVPVGADAPGRLTVRHETLDETAPPEPTLETPAGFTAAFHGWQRSGASTNPVRWTASVEIEQTDPQAARPARLVLRLGQQKLAIELVEAAR